MKILLSLFAMILANVPLFSQQDKTLFGDDFEMRASWAGIGFSTSKIKETNINQLGLDVGLEYEGRFITGYQYRSSIDETSLADLAANSRLRMITHNFLIGYTLPTYRVIHPRLTVGIGPGNIKSHGFKDKLFLVQPAAGLELNLFQWARLNLEAGYRLVSGVQTMGLINDDLNKFYGSISLRFGWSWGNSH